METNNCASCTYFHAGNGNCTAVGGFCTAVPAAKCPLLAEYLKTGLMPNDVLDLIGAHGMAILELVEAKEREKVRHGRWIKHRYICGANEYECSECHETEWRTSASRMKWCMFCGAQMDGG